ncbi:MAG: triose-phosphate isomerase, partial [Anaerococcus prevotii]|nr:triose-phosphate isomerase [Anaerococcus prevotii]
MSKTISRPFFIFNPKSYLYGQELYDLVVTAEDLSDIYKDKISILVTGPFADLANMVKLTKNAIISAQHMDHLELGRGMGFITAESLRNIGVQACFLNHAEHPMSLAELSKAINRARENYIETIVCADSIEEAKAIAKLNPDVILCEPTELIGTGMVSDDSYIQKTNEAIREV